VALLVFGAGIALIPAAGFGKPKRHVLTQGEFAVWVYETLVQTNDAPQSAQHEFTYTRLADMSPEVIDRAVRYLERRGLTPFEGWRASQPIRTHEMSSLIVRFHRADASVDISNEDQCVAFVRARGCDLKTSNAIIEHIRQETRLVDTWTDAVSESEGGPGFVPGVVPGATGAGQPGPDRADAKRACELANAEAMRERREAPFAPGDFRRTLEGGRVVFSALVPSGLDDLQAEVSFLTNGAPTVELSILTSRTTPGLDSSLGTPEIQDIRIERMEFEGIELEDGE